MHTYIYIYIHIHTYIYIYIYIYIYTHTYPHIHTVYLYVCIYIYICTVSAAHRLRGALVGLRLTLALRLDVLNVNQYYIISYQYYSYELIKFISIINYNNYQF